MFSSPLLSQRGPGFKIDTVSHDAITMVLRNCSAGGHWYSGERKTPCQVQWLLCKQVFTEQSQHRGCRGWSRVRKGTVNTLLTEQWTGSPYDRWQAEWSCWSCGNSQGLPKQMGTVVQRHGGLGSTASALTSSKG